MSRSRQPVFVAVLALAVVCVLALASTAADWPGFRGPNRDGTTSETGWSDKWPEAGPAKLWQAKVGIGVSSPVVADGKLYTMGNIDNEDVVVCLDAASGEEKWKYSYPQKFEARSYDGGTASTPVVDGKRLYVYSHKGYLLCLDTEKGTKVWDKDMMKEFGGRHGSWAYACSPLVEGKMVVVDVGGPGASTVALDKTNGNLIWKSGNDRVGYGSPVVYNIGAKRVIAILKDKAAVGLDAASGNELWRQDWPTQTATVPTPVVFEKTKLFISSGYRPGEGGVIETSTGKAKLVWRNANFKGCSVPPVIHEGHIYGFTGDKPGSRADLVCIDAAKGEVKWKQANMGTGGIILADGKLIVMSARGELSVAPASPEGFNPTSKARLMSGNNWVEPVLANGKLYCRSNKGDLVCLDVTPAKAD